MVDERSQQQQQQSSTDVYMSLSALSRQ
jgi:hypothetical protein